MKVLLKTLKGEEKTLDVNISIDSEVTSHHKYLVKKSQENTRFFRSSSKSRGYVRGGGRKPYRQKGTGNARRGTNRTPLRPGGGVIFGPSPRFVKCGVNKRLVKQVVKGMLLEHKEILVVKREDFSSCKTKDVASMFSNGVYRYTLILSQEDYQIYRVCNNLRNVCVVSVTDIPLSLLSSTCQIVFSESAFDQLLEVL